MEERYCCKLVTDLMLTREKDGKKEVLLSLRKNTGYRDGEFEDSTYFTSLYRRPY